MALNKTAIKTLVAIVAISLALPFSNAFSLSQSSHPSASNNNSQIEKLKADLEYASKEEQAEIKKYITIQEERKIADNNLNALNKKIRDAEAREKSARDTAAGARAEFAASQAKLDAAKSAYDSAQVLRQKAITRLYQDSSDGGKSSIATADPEDRPGIVRLSLLMKNYTDQQAQVIIEASSKAQDAEAEKLLFEDARIRAEAAEKVAATEAEALVPLRADLEVAQKAAKTKEAEAKTILDAIKAKKSSYNKQIAQLVAESNALAAKIKKEQNSNIPTTPGKMIKPINSSITSPFGYRTHPIYGDARLHAGIDLRASTGTPIKAAKNGKVIYASTLSGYGNVIIVDHGGGVSTLYAHQSAFAVGNGANVTQGQTIGYAGATGNVTGPHLHWEVRVNGAPVDPMGYL